MTRVNPTAGLHPNTQFAEIYRALTLYEFPWDVNQALSFALFRTYAVPTIGRLLHETGEFERRTQKRYDDTTLLLEAVLLHGFSDEEGRAAVRRVNQMHNMYDISNDDMRYVLATFVVVPKRWMDDYGWRRWTDDEVRASVHYYRMLGRHMAIDDIPETYDEFAQLMDTYERDHFAYDAGGRGVADATMALMQSFYPAPLRRAVDVFSRSLMDDPLLDAFGYRHPPRVAQAVSRWSLRLRGRVIAHFPRRRKPRYVHATPRIRSYPDGYDVREMGTFPAGRCPVSHQV